MTNTKKSQTFYLSDFRNASESMSAQLAKQLALRIELKAGNGHSKTIKKVDLPNVKVCLDHDSDRDLFHSIAISRNDDNHLVISLVLKGCVEEVESISEFDMREDDYEEIFDYVLWPGRKKPSKEKMDAFVYGIRASYDDDWYEKRYWNVLKLISQILGVK